MPVCLSGFWPLWASIAPQSKFWSIWVHDQSSSRLTKWLLTWSKLLHIRFMYGLCTIYTACICVYRNPFHGSGPTRKPYIALIQTVHGISIYCIWPCINRIWPCIRRISAYAVQGDLESLRINAKGGHSAAFKGLSTHHPIFYNQKLKDWGVGPALRQKDTKWLFLVQKQAQPLQPGTTAYTICLQSLRKSNNYFARKWKF